MSLSTQLCSRALWLVQTTTTAYWIPLAQQVSTLLEKIQITYVQPFSPKRECAGSTFSLTSHAVWIKSQFDMLQFLVTWRKFILSWCKLVLVIKRLGLKTDVKIVKPLMHVPRDVGISGWQSWLETTLLFPGQKCGHYFVQQRSQTFDDATLPSFSYFTWIIL